MSLTHRVRFDGTHMSAIQSLETAGLCTPESEDTSLERGVPDNIARRDRQIRTLCPIHLTPMAHQQLHMGSIKEHLQPRRRKQWTWQLGMNRRQKGKDRTLGLKNEERATPLEKPGRQRKRIHGSPAS